MADTSDAQLELKKRARRRLVGAAAFATLAAVVLPMVMDEAPPAPANDIQIKIPGQEQTSFAPRIQPRPPVPAVTAAPAVKPEPATPAGDGQAPKAPEKATEKTPEKQPERPVDKAAEKPTAKVAEKPAPKAEVKPEADSQRAAAILAGKNDAGAGQYVVLIGAFANAGNVKILQTKLGEMGIKTFTQPLDTPQGRKTRVRAGPFPNRQAAEKALDRMKKIGVGGVVAAKEKG